MKQGFGWGIGTSFARSFFGGAPVTVAPPVASPQPQASSEVIETKQYQQCILEGGGHEGCKHYLEMK